MAWGFIKSELRRACTFSFFDSLQKELPLKLDSMPLASVRRWFRRCLRFMDGYRKGMHGPLLDYAMKKYKQHRKIPYFDINDLRSEFERHKLY